jgi:hypothetical protein
VKWSVFLRGRSCWVVATYTASPSSNRVDKH